MRSLPSTRNTHFAWITWTYLRYNQNSYGFGRTLMWPERTVMLVKDSRERLNLNDNSRRSHRKRAILLLWCATSRLSHAKWSFLSKSTKIKLFQSNISGKLIKIIEINVLNYLVIVTYAKFRPEAQTFFIFIFHVADARSLCKYFLRCSKLV